MSNLTRREFVRQSILLAAGITLISCEDEKSDTIDESPRSEEHTSELQSQ